MFNAKQVRSFAENLKVEYAVGSLEALETLAETNYGVIVFRSPLFLAKTFCLYDGSNKRTYIFYEGLDDKSARFQLGHEIGHVALGHVYRKRRFFHNGFEESHADLFSRTLNSITKEEQSIIRTRIYREALRRNHFGIENTETSGVDKLVSFCDERILRYIAEQYYFPQILLRLDRAKKLSSS